MPLIETRKPLLSGETPLQAPNHEGLHVPPREEAPEPHDDVAALEDRLSDSGDREERPENGVARCHLEALGDETSLASCDGEPSRLRRLRQVRRRAPEAGEALFHVDSKPFSVGVGGKVESSPVTMKVERAHAT